MFDKFYFTKFNNYPKWQNALFSYIDRKGPVWLWLKRHIKQKAQILDYGCGNGYFSRHISSYFRVTAIDPSREALKLARSVDKNSKFILGTQKDIPGEKYEVVTCFDVFEHLTVDIHHEILKAFKKHLVKKGYLIVSMPNTGSLMRKIRGENWWALEDPTHVMLKNREFWLEHFAKYGFYVKKIYTSGFISHPLPRYHLQGWPKLAHFVTQAWGLLGGYLPSSLSDVDFYILQLE